MKITDYPKYQNLKKIIAVVEKMKAMNTKESRTLLYRQTITTLDKGLPRVPNNRTTVGGYAVGCCPRCNCFVEQMQWYCSDCGQAITWEVEDDAKRNS